MKNKIKRLDSTDKNVSKYIFYFNNAVAETVLYKYLTFETRTVICCSTQSGCPIGCRFCGAGDNFVRSLKSEEIMIQIQHIFKDRNINPKNVKRGQIMFMSMGEPLLNFKETAKAIRQLYRLYPNFALLISTSAPKVDYTDLYNLSADIPTIGLQFSIHETTDETRNKLIPFKNKLTLEAIAQTGNLWYAITKRYPFFNYCVHDKNNSHEDAERLYKLFDPNIWQATISVICERDETISVAHDRQRELSLEFLQKLNNYGYSTRCFDPVGQDDIGGGCGQLWHVQKWMRENPNLAKETQIGN